jgi:hypothetical protein
MATKVKDAIVEYLTGFAIAADVSVSLLAGVAIAINEDLKNPAFGISYVHIGKTAETLTSNDIAIDYNEVATISAANVLVGV